MRTTSATAIVIAIAATLSDINSAQTLVNGGFESDPLPAPTSYSYGSFYGWAAIGQAGYTRVASNNAFTNQTVEPPDGNQVAFIQNNGQLYANFNLPQTGPVVISFAATQRANGNVNPQQLELWIDGVRQSFMLGGSGAAQTNVQPPNGYYESYAVKAMLSAGAHTLRISGLGTIDSTSFVDTVTVSTPNNWGFGFWDQSLMSGAWRSDYSSQYLGQPGVPDGLGGVFTTTGCLFSQADITSGKILQITPAGPTALPTYVCVGGPGQPAYSISSGTANWSSYLYSAPQKHWSVGVNYEFLVNQTSAWGPPNQSAPIVTTGSTPGTRIVVTGSGPDTQFLAPSPAQIAHVIWNPYSPPSGKIAFSSFSANSVRGNGGPIAVADAAQSFRPFLEFKTMVADTNWKAFATWFSIVTSGWSDGIPRAIMIAILESGANFVPTGAVSQRIGWNWNIKNSMSYPGAIIAFYKASDLTVCGPDVVVPTLPAGLTLFQGGSNAMRSYRIDLRGLLACVTNSTKFANPAWGGISLPDPIVIRHVEWAIEPNDETVYNQGYIWMMTAGMRIVP